MPGDEQVFLDQIYFRYRSFLYYLARQKCSTPGDVEDVVQRTWELLLKKGGLLLEVPEEKRLAYLSVMVTNVIRMEARKKRPDTCSLEDLAEPGIDDTPELDRRLDRRTAISRFREAWPQVDPQARELLERKYILDQSNAEIAEAMQLNPNNLRSYLPRARKAAKKALLKQNSALQQLWKDSE